jgi:cupin 2 domain-containing protein
MKSGNFFAHIPARLPTELIQTLATGNGTRIERIVSKGHCSPPGYWYDQLEHEWVVLLQGEATLCFEKDGRIVHLLEGDYVHIAPHEKHRVERTAEHRETVWLAVFY